MNVSGESWDGGTNEANRLDEEWAQFNRELEKTAGDRDAAAQHQKSLEAIREDLFQRLDLYDVTSRVIDSSKERVGELFSEFVQSFREKRMQDLQLEWASLEAQEQAYRWMGVEALIAYYEELEFQNIVLHSAAILLNAIQNDISVEVAKYFSQGTKRELQAGFMVHYGYGLTDPWQRFFDQEAPGESLNPDDPDGRMYIQAAYDDRDEFLTKRAKKYQILEKARAIAGIDDQNDDEAVIVYATYVLIEMHISASTAHFRYEEQNRSERLWELARLLQCEYGALAEIVKLYETEYPLDN